MNPFNFFKTGISKTQYQKLLITLSIVFGVSTIITFVISPVITNGIIKYVMSLKPGHYLREKHKNIPFVLKLYLWNVTNPDEVMQGGKPVMKDIGPYVFDVKRESFNEEDNDKDDTVTYDMWNTMYFRPDLTAPLTGNENLLMINLILVAGATKFYLESPEMMPFLKAGMGAIFENPSSIFFNVKASEILYEGVNINCNQKIFPAKTVCGFMKGNSNIKSDSEDLQYKFAILNGLNDSIVAKFTALRGGKNSKDLGKIVALNGKPEQDIFENEQKHCNVVNGTDKTLFPPFETKDELVWVFVPQACRSLVSRHKNEKKRIDGIQSHFKESDFGDEEMPAECSKNKYVFETYKSTLDLYPCNDLFLLASGAHFLNCDEKLLDSIEGINPDKVRHRSGVYIHLKSGVPVSSNERVQISVKLVPVPEYPILSNVRDLYMPLFWYDEQYDLDKGSKRILLTEKYSRIITAVICYTLMTLSALTAIGLTFVFVTNKVPETPEIGEAAHKQIEEAIAEINQNEFPQSTHM